MKRKGWSMVLYTAGGSDGGGIISGGGDLRLFPLEHSWTVYCDQDHYGPLSASGAESRVKGC